MSSETLHDPAVCDVCARVKAQTPVQHPGGNKHAGRHTGRYFNMTRGQLLSDLEVQKLREESDAVEALCQKLEKSGRLAV